VQHSVFERRPGHLAIGAAKRVVHFRQNMCADRDSVPHPLNGLIGDKEMNPVVSTKTAALQHRDLFVRVGTDGAGARRQTRHAESIQK